jgi:murein DD-endopeptidase MepM/ murein hydrolase activator NlpD
MERMMSAENNSRQPKVLRFGLNAGRLLVGVVLATATWSCGGQTNSLRILNTPGGLQVNYSLANSNGAFFLLQSGQPSNILNEGQVVASGIASVNPSGVIDAGLPTNTISFFDLVQDPTVSATTNDLIAIDDGDAAYPASLFLESSNLPSVLTANTPFTLTLQISDTNGNVVPTNGQISLYLEDGDGTTITFAYTLIPSAVTVTSGIAQTILTIQTTNSLNGLYLAGKFTGQGPHLLDATAGAQVGRTAVPYATYSDPDTTSWNYPLPSVVPLSGAFGEWPGHSDLHLGIDFSAVTGTSVLAAKKGVVVKINDVSPKQTMGKFVAIYHGNGYVTRYLHITPNVNPGDVVTKGQEIGTVYKWAHPHLHFEMLQLFDPAFYNTGKNYQELGGTDFSHSLENFPGLAVNPIGNPNFTFSSPLFANGGHLPVVKGLFFRADHPATTPLYMDPMTPCLERLSDPGYQSPVYLVFQVVEQTTGGVLPPKQITFTPDVGPATNITYGLWETNIYKLDPRYWRPANGSGYALLPDFESNPNTASAYRGLRYKYWFAWDTSQYTDSPHSFTVKAIDLAGNPSQPAVFTFGPQTLGVYENLTNCGSYLLRVVTFLGTNGPALTQEDQYRFQIIQPDGSVLPGVQWDYPVTTYPSYGHSEPLNNHQQTNFYSFTPPSGTITSGLKLQTTSLLVTNLYRTDPLLSYSGNYTGDYSGIPISMTVYPGGAVQVQTTSLTGAGVIMFGEVNQLNGSISASGCYADGGGPTATIADVTATGRAQNNAGTVAFSGSFTDGQDSGAWSVAKVSNSQLGCAQLAFVGTYVGTSPAGGSGSFTVDSSGYVTGTGGGSGGTVGFNGFVNLATGALSVQGCFYDTDNSGKPFVNGAVGTGTLVNSGGSVTASGTYSTATDSGSWSATKQ